MKRPFRTLPAAPLFALLLALAVALPGGCSGGAISPGTFGLWGGSIIGDGTTPGTGRAFHTAVIDPATADVFLMGGQAQDGTPLTDVAFAERYRFGSERFIAEPDFTVASGRIAAAGAQLGSGVLVGGGGQAEGVTTCPDLITPVQCLPATSSNAGGDWYANPPGDIPSQEVASFAAGLGAALVTDAGGTLYAIGGRDGAGNPSNQIVKITIGGGGFIQTTVLGVTLNSAREGHTATLLSNGKILIVGGWGPSAAAPGTWAELFDPSATPDPTVDYITGSPPWNLRALHTATRSSGGRVLIYGGLTAGGGLAGASGGSVVAEVYDEISNGFTPYYLGNPGPRVYHAATRLTNGRVLITGGVDETGAAPLDTALLFRFDLGFRATRGPMIHVRFGHTATLLGDCTVLVAGGLSAAGTAEPEAELYVPETC